MMLLAQWASECADFWKRLMLLMGHNGTQTACKEAARKLLKSE